MKNEVMAETQARAEFIEQVSNASFLLGIIGVYQQNIEAGIWLGAALLIAGVLGSIASMLMRGQVWQRVVERIAIFGMMIGILGMLQGWEIKLYEYGFYILGISTLAFIIVSHIPVPDSE